MGECITGGRTVIKDVWTDGKSTCIDARNVELCWKEKMTDVKRDESAPFYFKLFLYKTQKKDIYEED
jgi:protein gp37